MTFRVEVTPAAKLQIQEAYAWYQKNGSSNAALWLDGLLKALETLKQFPNRCPLAPENDLFQVEIRQLLYGKGIQTYRILFTVTNQTVFVLHVRHRAKARLGAEGQEE